MPLPRSGSEADWRQVMCLCLCAGWGENLAGAITQPVRLTKPERLIYSPHTYGPSVYAQSYFKTASFPTNMPKIWDARFAFLAKEASGVGGLECALLFPT